MSNVEEAYTGQRADQENHVEPSMIEVELEVAQNFRDDGSEKQIMKKWYDFNTLCYSVLQGHQDENQSVF